MGDSLCGLVLAEFGVGADDAKPSEPPVEGNTAVDEPQPGLDAAEAPWQPPATAQPRDTIPVPPLASTRQAHRNGLRQAAQVLLAAWDASVSADALDEHFAGLRAALAGLTTTSPSADHRRPPRDTKRAQLLAMLGRPEGASGPEISEAMGWASHTVRSFLTGLAKKGMAVEVVERVRQIGPNKQGSKSSYAVYRLGSKRQP